jgi:predicted MPP superfamily phosphohydrolase
MAERARPRVLLRRAREILDDSTCPLAAASRDAWRGLFASGGEWMRLALSHLRGQNLPTPGLNVNALGTIKYGLASGAALVVAAGAVLLHAWPLLLLCVPAFYAVEAQMVFLFPVALDGAARPFREARRWTACAGGTLAVMAVVLPLAAFMLFGGFLGQGFVRSWCLGCLAVCIWYEDLRGLDPSPPSPLPRDDPDARHEVNAARERGASGPDPPGSNAHQAPTTYRRRQGTCTPLSPRLRGQPTEQDLVGGGRGDGGEGGDARGVKHLLRRVFPFEFGAFGSLAIRREAVHLGLGRRVRLLYASDLHLGHWWNRDVPAQLVAACRHTSPDLILLGGDLADHPGALDQLRSCVRELAAMSFVAALAGNHDERAGLAHVRAVVTQAGGRWLLDSPLEEPLGIDAELSSAPSSGARLLCAHYPDVFPDAVRAGYRLVLAGHLHGGQCVLATVNGRLYPAVCVYPWHGLRFTDGDARMIVSRGVADTFPLRFNCPREVILCEIS